MRHRVQQAFALLHDNAELRRLEGRFYLKSSPSIVLPVIPSHIPNGQEKESEYHRGELARSRDSRSLFRIACRNIHADKTLIFGGARGALLP